MYGYAYRGKHITMIELGAIAMRFALVAAIYACGLSLLGARQRRERLVQSAERAVYGVFGLVTIAMVAMLTRY